MRFSLQKDPLPLFEKRILNISHNLTQTNVEQSRVTIRLKLSDKKELTFKVKVVLEKDFRKLKDKKILYFERKIDTCKILENRPKTFVTRALRIGREIKP